LPAELVDHTAALFGKSTYNNQLHQVRTNKR
jgi:hypothetical protein